VSLLKKIGKVLKPIAKAVLPVASAVLPFTGPVGAGIGIALKAASTLKSAKNAQAIGQAVASSYPLSPINLPSMAMSLTGTASAGALPPIVGAATRVIPGAGRAAAGVIRGGAAAAAGRAAGTMTRTAVGYFRKYGRKAAEAAGWISAGMYWVDSAGNIVGRKSTRRMNPLNARALRRAIRRVKGAKGICHEVEKITGGHRRRAAASCPPRKRC
jgi:hypothetical protein